MVSNFPEPSEIERLLAQSLDGRSTEADRRRLNQLAREDDQALLAIVEHLETEALLRWHHGEAQLGDAQFDHPVERAELVHSAADNHRLRKAWPVAAGLCAVVLVCAVLFRQAPRFIGLQSPLEAGWSITPIGAAEYERLSPGSIRLVKGELLVASNAAAEPSQPLSIETPNGNALARGTEFLIGTHTLDMEGESMRHITRVLVLAGSVLLSNTQGEVLGEESQLLSADGAQAPARQVVAANSEFAVALYKQLAQENDQNLFFSPFSISIAMAMTAEGARGTTAEEIGQVLRFPQAARRIGGDAQTIPWRTALIHTGIAQLHTRFNKSDSDPKIVEIKERIADLEVRLATANLLVSTIGGRSAYKRAQELADELNELLPQVDQFELSIANALWGEQSYPFHPSFVQTIDKFYDTGGVFPCDFQRNHNAERLRINDWIAEQTNQRIMNAIPSRAVNSRTRLILTNAVHFKGDWAEPFEARRTKLRPFTLADGTAVKTLLMSDSKSEASYAAFQGDGSPFKTPVTVAVDRRGNILEPTYPESNGFLMLELPYRGDELSMVFFAPQDPAGLPRLEKQLSGRNMAAWTAGLAQRDVRVQIPKFKFETTYELGTEDGGTLPNMGMRQAFRNPQHANGADFSGMSASGKRELFLGSVLHRAFVDVNEKGTEAAAVTIGLAKDEEERVERRPFTPYFKADRPFLFVIRDRVTGTVLFMGRMQQPPESSQPQADD